MMSVCFSGNLFKFLNFNTLIFSDAFYIQFFSAAFHDDVERLNL
jgi:hypothetical protein